MAFSFLHTADWHIGKAFRMMPANLAGQLEAARLSVIDRLAACARDHGAEHVLVAGDVYDSDGVSRKTMRQPIERMKRHDDLNWVLLPGNHDPGVANGIWQKVLDDDLPSNVTVLLEAGVFQLTKDVCVLPAPITNRGVAQDLSLWMDDAVTPPGILRVGLAHGSTRGFGSSTEKLDVIDVRRAKSAGLDYLALGDWHGKEAVNDRTWYSGTPEPDQFPNNEPGYALVVTLEGEGCLPDVMPVRTAQFSWAMRSTVLSEVSDIDTLDDEINSLSSDPAHLLLRITLDGMISAGVLTALANWRDRLEARVAHLDVIDDGLGVELQAGESGALQENPELLAAAEKLEAIIADGGDERQGVAKAALRRLVMFSEVAAGASR